MTAGKRALKRSFIILVYLLILGAFAGLIYLAVKPAATCHDGIKNQGETDIDCGGSCTACQDPGKIENLVIADTAIIPLGNGKYDALVEINNPNSQYGIAKFEYSFDLHDQSGNVIAQKPGTGFILPSQTKYYFAFNIETRTEPETLEFRIQSFSWSKFSEYQEPNISVYSKEFNLVSGGSGFAELKAKIRNMSGFDLKNIGVKAVIRDKNGRPVALNQTNHNDVRTNEEREVILSWMEQFVVQPETAKIEIQTEVDVFDNSNYMKKYGSQEQYESYGGSVRK